MTSRRKLVGSLALAAVVAVGLASCGNDDDHASSSTSTSTTVSGNGVKQGPSTTGPPAMAPSSAPVADAVKAPVGTGVPVDFGGGVTATMTGTKALDVEARGAGETSGPAVAATIEVRNGSNQPFDLATIALTGTYGGGTPAIPSSADPAQDLSGQLAPGATATGVYVFRVPKGDADTLVIQVQSGVKPNVPQFKV